MNSVGENAIGNEVDMCRHDDSNSKYTINGDILDQLESEKQTDHLMSNQLETHDVPFLEDDCGYARPLYPEEVIQHLGDEKDMEQRIAEEVEDHRSRLFGIVADFRNNLGCAFEQSVPEAGSLTPLNINSEQNFGDLPLNGYNAEDDSFQNASFSSGQTLENGIVDSSPTDIECTINKQLLYHPKGCSQLLCPYLLKCFCKKYEGSYESPR